MEALYLIIIYLLIVNILAFAAMGFDKWKAKRRAFRIPEATLFILAIIGGSIGALAGMYTFRHKTKHASFVIGMPVILAIQVILILLLIYSPLQVIFL